MVSKTVDIGFDKSDLLYMPMTGEMGDKQGALNAELKAATYCKCYGYHRPISNLTSSTTGVEWEGMALQDKNIWFSKTWVTDGFFDVLFK